MAALIITASLRAEVRAITHTARINHPECPAGTDRKRRLFVAATPRGHYLYCWHCGGEGFIGANLRGRAALDALEPPAASGGPAHDYPAAPYIEWTRARRVGALDAAYPGMRDLCAWLAAKHADVPEIIGAFRVSPARQAVELRVPIYRGNPPRLVGYQGRQFGPYARRYPKYLEERWAPADTEAPAILGDVPTKPWGGAWRAPRVEGSPVIVVESFADAAYLANLGYIAAALCGTNLQDGALLKLARALNGRAAVVWLDNDITSTGFRRADIAAKAQDLAQRLALYAPTRCWIDLEAPTQTSAATLAEMLGHDRQQRIP